MSRPATWPWVREVNIFGTVFVALAIWGAACLVLVPVLVGMLVG